MDYILFFVYLGLFCWLIPRIQFISSAGIDQKIIIALFSIRVIAGVINGYMNLYFYSGTDTAYFQLAGLTEYNLLFNDPKEYFVNIFKDSHGYAGLLDTKDSFWNNLRTNLIIKLLSIFNIFSRGNFFINTLFYNFLIFFGSISFYKVFNQLLPGKKGLLIITLFLLPSVTYFSSAIHREGLIFLGLGILCNNLFDIINKQKYSYSKFLWIGLGILLIVLIRNFVFITLIPAVTGWIIAEKNKRFALLSFIIIYLLFISVFFSSGWVHPKLNLPQYVSDRQIAFVEIAKQGKSAININPLFPNFRSFLNNAPQALNHALMRPYITEKFTLLYIFVEVEIFVYQLLFLLFLFFRVKAKATDPFLFFCTFFGISMFLMIGYTIPIIGALIRYRSIYFPLLLIPIVCYTDWKIIKNLLHFK